VGLAGLRCRFGPLDPPYASSATDYQEVHMGIRRVLLWMLLSGALVFAASAKAEDTPRKQEKKFAPQALGMELPVITSADEREKYVGRLVAVRGVISNYKLPDIAGVRVDAALELSRSESEAYAVGILVKSVFSEEEYRKIQDEARSMGNLVGVAIPGPGTFYKIVVDLNGKRAEAQRLPK
jgi:hypothetical protein